MGEAKQKKSRKQRFLQKNPICCFCGGAVQATTWDHVPPRACFPEGHSPEGFEFPACENCNQGTRENDQIFGFYAQLTDFDSANYDHASVDKLKRGIANNRSDALPMIGLSANQKRAALRHMNIQRVQGETLNDVPLIGVPPVFDDAAATTGRKLACALNYRERDKIIPYDYKITVGWNQLQNKSFEQILQYFARLLPDHTFGNRPNLKNYGQRFGYKSGVNESEDLFVYAAQFGAGLIVWGIVTPPGTQVDEPLASMTHTIFGPAPDLEPLG